MADDDQDDSNKTEEPSDRKLQKAQEQGQVAFTKEIGSNMALIGIGLVFYMWGLAFFGQIVNHFRFTFGNLDRWENIGPPFWSRMVPLLTPLAQFIALVFLIAFIFPILGHVLQKGMSPKWEALEVSFDKLNPIKGIKQQFSVEPIILFVKNLLKTFGLGLIFFVTIRPYIDRIVFMPAFPIETALDMAGVIFIKFFLYALLFLVVLSAVDYFVSYRRTRKKLMMTRQEVKDEFKDMEGNPEIRGKVKQMQRERAKRKIQKEVPKATVVVTNPTHYAVAIKYERGKYPVPRVMVKGVDLLAARIREVAQENRVPIVASPALARALYREVKEGKEIPYKFYKAVAKIIGTILRLEEEKKRRKLVSQVGQALRAPLH